VRQFEARLAARRFRHPCLHRFPSLYSHFSASTQIVCIDMVLYVVSTALINSAEYAADVVPHAITILSL